MTENGNTFGRRHISLFLEQVSSLRLDLGVGSLYNRVELEHVLTMYTPSDFSERPQIFNFTNAMGKTVPSALQIEEAGLELTLGKNYSVAAIVTGFLNGDKSVHCQQVAQSQLRCEKRETLECDCPPCLGETLADLSGTGNGNENPIDGGNPSGGKDPSGKSKDKETDKGKDKGKNPTPPKPAISNNPPTKPPIKGSITTSPTSGGKETKKMLAITRFDGK